MVPYKLGRETSEEMEIQFGQASRHFSLGSTLNKGRKRKQGKKKTK